MIAYKAQIKEDMTTESKFSHNDDSEDLNTKIKKALGLKVNKFFIKPQKNNLELLSAISY